MRVLQISACGLRFAYIHATVYIFVFIRSFAPEICFHTEKKYSKRGRVLLRRVRVSFTSIRGAARRGEARRGNMFKALPVIFRGVSAYLYRPRFRFYIASHRYAPQGTPARRAILSHDKRAINFCETAPSRPASTFHACTRTSLSVLLHAGVTSFAGSRSARETRRCVFAQRGDRDFAQSRECVFTSI